MKTIEEIEKDLKEWQEADPDGRQASIVAVRSWKNDAGSVKRDVIFSMFGDLAVLSSAYIKAMYSDETVRRMFLSIFRFYITENEFEAD